MTSRHVELVVEAEHDGLRLDQFLAGVLPGQSRSQIQRLIKDDPQAQFALTLFPEAEKVLALPKTTAARGR